MDKFKDFSRRSFIACIWFLFYLIAQTISAIALFLIQMFTDTSFVKQFLELFAPRVASDSNVTDELFAGTDAHYTPSDGSCKRLYGQDQG